MNHKSTLFYRGNTAVSVDFSAEEISSDGALVLLEKIERAHKLFLSCVMLGSIVMFLL